MDQGDENARLARVSDAARRTFGSREFADLWLNTPNPALSDQVPVKLAATDAGLDEVKAVLSRLAHGDYS